MMSSRECSPNRRCKHVSVNADESSSHGEEPNRSIDEDSNVAKYIASLAIEIKAPNCKYDLSMQDGENYGNIGALSQLSNDSTDIKQLFADHNGTNISLAYNRISTKIACTKDSIKKEQTSRDANVNEYLKLAANADKQQLQRIKAVFEKKNQKSANNISQLQKKLETYNKRYRDMQYHHSQKQRQPRVMLRDMSQGLRNVGGNILDGVSGLSATVMSKPREFAHLIKNKFGSADNINQIPSNHNIIEINRELNSSHIKGSIPYHFDNLMDTNLGMSGVVHPTDVMAISTAVNIRDISGKYNEQESECSSMTSDSIQLSSDKERILRSHKCTHYQIVNELRDDYDRLQIKLERLEILNKDVAELSIALDTERYRAERLEEQLNDLTELHQNQIENMKQTIADLEEKVQYQSDERLRDVYEIMENCQTRVSKIEHLSQQQYVTMDGIENSNARAVVVKLINVVLTLLQVFLLVIATAAGITMPFLNTRVRVLTTTICILSFVFVVRQRAEIISICFGWINFLNTL